MPNDAPPCLSFSDLVLKSGRTPITGALKGGEILGLAGLEGQGHERFLEVLAGVHTPASGQVHLGDIQAPALRNLHHAAREGVAYLPKDRRATGIFPVMSVLDNFGLPSMSRFSRAGLIERKRQRARYKEFERFLEIRTPGEHAPISALSGGNQQKVLLARWLAMDPKVLLLNDPTRGVDLNTRLKFYDAFRQLRDAQGLSLVILSSEIEEILEICDRVLVFRDHELEREIGKDEMTMDGVLAAMFGQEST